MMRAYIPAQVVSILGTYTCYHYSKRDDGKNAGSAKLVPEGYYANLREVLDVVVAGTEPGALRDRVLRRFYRVEMLGRLSEPAVLTYDDAFLREMTDAVRPLALDFMGGSVHDGLGPVLRLRSELLRADDEAGLVRLARFASSVRGGVRLEDLAWQPDGRIAVRISARLVHGEDREPLTMVRRDGRVYLDPAVTDRFLPAGELVDVTDDLRGFTAELSLRDRETAVEWPCPASFTAEVADRPDGTCEVVLHGTGHLATEGGRKGRGSLPRGFWDAWVTVRGSVSCAGPGSGPTGRSTSPTAACRPCCPAGRGRSSRTSPTRTAISRSTWHGAASGPPRICAAGRCCGCRGRPSSSGWTCSPPAPPPLGRGRRRRPELVLTKPSDDGDLAEATVVHSAPGELRPALDRAHLTLPGGCPGRRRAPGSCRCGWTAGTGRCCRCAARTSTARAAPAGRRSPGAGPRAAAAADHRAAAGGGPPGGQIGRRAGRAAAAGEGPEEGPAPRGPGVRLIPRLIPPGGGRPARHRTGRVTRART
ncbi:glycosyltransferase family 2 protein [Streptomyces zhihengii]